MGKRIGRGTGAVQGIATLEEGWADLSLSRGVWVISSASKQLGQAGEGSPVSPEGAAEHGMMVDGGGVGWGRTAVRLLMAMR